MFVNIISQHFLQQKILWYPFVFLIFETWEHIIKIARLYKFLRVEILFFDSALCLSRRIYPHKNVGHSAAVLHCSFIFLQYKAYFETKVYEYRRVIKSMELYVTALVCEFYFVRLLLMIKLPYLKKYFSRSLNSFLTVRGKLQAYH